MDSQNNNGVVPPVGGEIAASGPAPAPNPAPAAPAAAKPAAASTANPTAQFAQSTVGNNAAATQPVAPKPSYPGNTQVVSPYTNAAPAGKKGGAGKIIVIILILLLLIGLGIGGFFFYRAHESKERILSDALKSYINREAPSISSTITLTPSEDPEGKYGDSKIVLTLTASEDNESDNYITLDAKIESDTEEVPSMNAKLEAMVGKDALYVKLADSGNLATSIGELAKDETIEYGLAAIFNKIGNDWYEIPYSKLGSSFSDAIECSRNAQADLKSGKYNDELAGAFEKYPFLSIDGKGEKADGYTLYTIKTDKDLAEKFGKELENLSFYKELNRCVESNNRSTSLKATNGSALFETILGNGSNATDKTVGEDDLLIMDNDDDLLIDEYDDSLVSVDTSDMDMTIKFGIKFWSHELVYVSMEGVDNSSHTKLAVEAKISDGSNIDMPSNATDIEVLIEEISGMLNTNNAKMDEYYDLYCTEEKNFSGYGNREKCIEAVDQMFDNSGTDIESLINGLNI